MNGDKERRRITIERTYNASVQDLWDLWTTKEGIESWWGPDGFATKVLEIALRPGGQLLYEMTAIASAQVEFMKKAKMPLTNQNRITYTEVIPNRRIAYTHLADFIPGVEPYDVGAVVEFHVDGQSVRMVLTFDPMHDEQWTRRAVMGHESQLGKLDRVIAARIT
jgi:uncharacterized protein YndB with AHSA1/START domain